jgi:uncharacterized membrane protein YeaQ/YmgE (transglycosylase-associated protein family)
MTVAIVLAVTAASILAGWLAGLVTRGDGFGLAGNIAVALAGGFSGAYLLSALAAPFAHTLFGAALFALICAFLTLAAIAEMRR